MLDHTNKAIRYASPIDVVAMCSNVVKFVRREIGEIVRYSRDQKTTKFRLPLELSLLRGSRPNLTRASPQHLASTVPDFIQIGLFSAEL